MRRSACVNASGTGPDSEPVGARLAPGSSSPLLVVNGFDRRDRYVKEHENPFDWVTVNGAAIDAIVAAGYPFDSATNESVAANHTRSRATPASAGSWARSPPSTRRSRRSSRSA